MKIWPNIKYYFNYLNFIRGDNNIRNYFLSNENYKAIKELTEEGYTEFYENFCEIVDSYSNLYPLNSKELKFIEFVKRKSITNVKSKASKDYISLDAKVKSAINYLNSFNQYNININNQYQIEIFQYETKVMKKSLERIWPMTEAVITRRFCKKLLELLIKKNINLIDIENYTPDIQLLKNYVKSLKLNYIPFRKGINIESEMKKFIENFEAKTKNEPPNKDIKKKNPKIVYFNEKNNDIKSIKLMLKMKNECNAIIHFNKKFAEKININDYIYDNFEINIEENDIQDKNEGEIKIDEININVPKKDKLISVSNVAKFIAYGHPDNSNFKSLETLSQNIKEKLQQIQIALNGLEKTFNIRDYEIFKNSMLSVKTLVNDNLKKLVLNDYDLSLSEEDVVNFGHYFNENVSDIGDIREIEVNLTNNENKMNYVNYFNRLRRNMNIKDRLKFNATFEANISMINIKKSLNAIIPQLEKIEQVKQVYDEINDYYNKNINVLKSNINNITISINFMKREQIFTEISQDELITTLQSDFQNIKIDCFDSEINNFFLYIFLLKKNLYDEKSYKSAVVNDDYM